MFSKPIDPEEAVQRMEHAEHPRAERAILSHAEAYRLVEEARAMREERDAALAEVEHLTAERDALAAIVRELAERGPYALFGVADEPICTMCNTSGFGASADWFDDPAHHEPSCIWRRAKALYP
jgi:hypothetical protein